MFGTKLSDPFEALVREAEKVSAERAELLTQMGENQASLAAAEEALAGANKRAADEEFQAAQAPDGLAVASKAALALVDDAKLRAKTVQFRLRGLQAKLAAIDQKLASSRAALESYVQEFFEAKISDLKTQFDDAIEGVIRLFFKTVALRKHCGKKVREQHRFYPLRYIPQAFLPNPVTAHGAAILPQSLFRMRDGRQTSVDEHWDSDPDVCQLLREIRAIKDRIAEVTGAEAEDEGQQD